MECLRANAESCKFAATTSFCERKTLKAYKPMKIVQTFWSGGRSPLEHSYGWLHAEYNLMSWTLSCLSLRKHYDRVELYTDRRGYEVLIEKLHLPYTAVHVVYDDDLCLPQHWAYAKIKTYSMQTEPFLHVDGDVYIGNPFCEELLHAPLVVQNEEIGTAYYKSMLDAIRKIPGVKFPDYAYAMLDAPCLPSFNMGVFGGNDLAFIKDYCKEAECFLRANRMNDADSPSSLVDSNVFFEQVLFALYTVAKRRNVSKVISVAVRDNGYASGVFCDVYKLKERSLLHILGGHKQILQICHSVADTLLANHAHYHRNIIGMTSSPAEICIFRNNCSYDDFLNRKRCEWRSIARQDLMAREKQCANSLLALSTSDITRESVLVSLPQNLIIYTIAKGRMEEEEREYIRKRLRCEKNFPLKRIALTPSLLFPWVNEFALIEEDEHIISYLQHRKKPVTIRELQEESICRHKCADNNAGNRIRKYIIEEITLMAQARVLAVQTDSIHSKL